MAATEQHEGKSPAQRLLDWYHRGRSPAVVMIRSAEISGPEARRVIEQHLSANGDPQTSPSSSSR